MPFGCGALFYLLRNRFYVGEVNYRGQIYPSEQPPILDRKVFYRVQRMLSSQRSHQTRNRTSFSHLLTGLIFDDAGHRMSPTQAQRNERHYGYDVSRPLLFGDAATANVGSVSRGPAHDVDDQVGRIVLTPRIKNKGPASIDNAFACVIIERIEVQQQQFVVKLKPRPDDDAEEPESTIVIPWIKPPSKRARSILHPTTAKLPLRPMKLERRATLVIAIARGRRWLDELVAGHIPDTQSIARREHCSVRQVNLTLSLTFLAPPLVKAAVEGRLPHGISPEQLRQLPSEWDRQFETLALDPI